MVKIHKNTFGSEPYLIRLGNHVEITAGVRFVTHDGGVWVFRREHPEIDIIAPIIIEDNVFVGMNSIILPGVVIGSNSVIGAGSVVTQNIPSNCVAAGVPARPIKTLGDYWDSVSGRSFYFRSLPAAEKKRRLENHFWGDAGK